jgi:hypothetical protein
MDVQYKMTSNTSNHTSSYSEEESQINRTHEDCPDRGEQDVADMSMKTKFGKLWLELYFVVIHAAIHI